MSDENSAYRLAEIERNIKEFKEKFEAKTSDPNDFITISEIEALWSELQHNTKNIYSDMLMDMMSNVDETGLIHKKKSEYRQKGIILRTHQKNTISVISLMGKISYSRYMLIPHGTASKTALLETTGAKSIHPVDSFLGISGLPFKITPSAMLKIAFWAQNQPSYQRAEDAIREALKIEVNDDTVRLVANYVGNVAFQNDCIRADAAMSSLDSGKLTATNTQNAVLYIQADGAALNTRLKNKDGSTWRENKLGEVFTSNDIRYWTDKKGVRQHQLRKKEYVSYVGPSAEFKKHLLACALRHGYGKLKNTVFISDGATWIRNMVEEIFPDAQQILDFFHLAENVNTYAKHIFGGDDSRAKSWAADICNRLKNGKHQDVIKLLKSMPASQNAKAPVNLSAYIKNNEKNINYPEYLKKGRFIGSGAIERGNKIVLQDRLKRAGMRWNLETAQAMLTLKAKAGSGLWYTDVELPFFQHCRRMAL